MSEAPSTGPVESVVVDEKVVKKVGLPDKLWFRTLQGISAVVANVVVLAGVGFAIQQIRSSNEKESRRIAIEAVGQTRSAEFTKAFRQLKAAYETKRIDQKDKEALIDSLNHVMNVYDHVAILYISNIADRCIIKDSIYSGAKEMSTICDAMAYPADFRTNFDKLLQLMDAESCNNNR